MTQLDELQPISSATAVKIVDAASHLFMQRGYKAVSINDIIRAADITKPTLYYYFSDKEELFVQMGLRVLAEMGDRVRLAADTRGGLSERLRSLAAVLMADQDTDMRMMRHEMFEHLGPANRDRLARAFFSYLYRPIVAMMEQGLADGELGRHNAPALAQMFMGMTESFHEFGRSAAYNRSEATAGLFAATAFTPDTLVDLFLHGVGSGAAPA
jgi:AcrR family transcriptional regulator